MHDTDVFLDADDFDDLDGSLNDFDDIKRDGIRDPIPELLSLDALFEEDEEVDACVPEDEDAMTASASSADLRPDLDEAAAAVALDAAVDANCR